MPAGLLWRPDVELEAVLRHRCRRWQGRVLDLRGCRCGPRCVEFSRPGACGTGWLETQWANRRRAIGYSGEYPYPVHLVTAYQTVACTNDRGGLCSAKSRGRD